MRTRDDDAPPPQRTHFSSPPPPPSSSIEKKKKKKTKKGVLVYLSSQCRLGPLHPELYKAGSVALSMGVEPGVSQMTPECAAAKMMLCLAHPDVPLGVPLAGEM